MMTAKKLSSVLLVLALTQSISGNNFITTDWPQWQGPNRTGLSTETGLLKAWPEKGPKVVWTIANLGAGYGSMAIKGNNILVQGVQGNESVEIGRAHV